MTIRKRSLPLAFMLLAMHASAGAEPEVRYISGSYVNVRAQAAHNADVVDHLIVNTPVYQLSRSSDFCEISWGKGSHGFVACSLVGSQPLRIENVGEKYKRDTRNRPVVDGQGNLQLNPDYSALRAFWIEPTVERLFDAGKYFEDAVLPSGQREKERNGPVEGLALKRFPLPEFDAMKALLTNGIVSPRSQYVAPRTWKDVKTTLNGFDKMSDVNWQQISKVAPHGLSLGQNGDIDPVKRAMAVGPYLGIKLPRARPSFFKHLRDVGRPGDGTETLSAQFGVPFRMRVLRKPYWGGDNNSYPLLVGAWDVGEVETMLVKPVYDVAIGIDGQVSVSETAIQRNQNRGDDSMYCAESFMQPDSGKLIKGYKRLPEPWIFFRLASPPALKHAKVTLMLSESYLDPEEGDAAEQDQETQSKPAGKKTAAFRLKDLAGQASIAYIDLDNDGVADLAVWDDGNPAAPWPGDERQRLIFANVLGTWYLLDTDILQACNC